MRIWMLTSEVPREAEGGIGRYVDTFSRLLGAAGHHVTIIVRAATHPYDEQLAPGVQLIGLTSRYERLSEPNPGGAPDTHPGYPYNILSYWPAWSYQLAEEVLSLFDRLLPPDVIEAQEYEALAYYLLQRKLTEESPLKKIPFVIHLHSPVFEIEKWNQHPRYRFPEYWVGQMEKFCIVGADAVLSPSAFLAHRVQQMVARSLPITCIPHPLTVRYETVGEDIQPHHLVYVGRLEVRKGVLPLVKACQRLWESGVDFRLTMIGNDSTFLPKDTTVATFLRERYAKWMETGHLTLTGLLGREDVLTHLRQAWAMVIPSLWENFPNTCLEGMGVGQVVLASRAGGQAEMIETSGVNGFLFDWENSGEFEQQLQTVLGLSVEDRKQIGRCAQERIQTFCDPQTILARRIQHFEEVIARHAFRRLFPVVNAEPIPTAVSTVPVRPESAAQVTEQAGLLSVVVPYHNLGTYVGETLESLLASTYVPYEVLIVNDGSTDPKSLEALHEIEERQLPQVRVLHTVNQGLATARNVGATESHGEFIAFVDADDKVTPEFFSRAIAVLQQYENVSFVSSWVQFFDLQSDIWPTWNAEFPYLLGHNMMTPLVVVRRDTFLRHARNNPLVEYSLEDYEGWVGLLEAGGVGVSLPHPLVQYRIRTGSMYRSANRNQFLYLYDLMTQLHPEAYRKWGVELFNLQNMNGPGYLWGHPAAAMTEPPQAYVASLEQTRDKLWTDVQTLGKAWEDHVKFIEAQRVYIQELEARSNELIAAMHNNGAPPSVALNGISWRDYELGGRFVSRLRKTWVARRVLRSPALKKMTKQTCRLAKRLIKTT